MTRRHLVLCVDDNDANLLLIQRALEHRPHIELITASRGLIALEMARDHQPELVMLDFHLPDINGDRVLARLRDDELTRAIPVVMLSADASDHHMVNLKAAGAFEYLTKPLNIRRLLEIIDELIIEPAASIR